MTLNVVLKSYLAKENSKYVTITVIGKHILFLYLFIPEEPSFVVVLHDGFIALRPTPPEDLMQYTSNVIIRIDSCVLNFDSMRLVASIAPSPNLMVRSSILCMDHQVFLGISFWLSFR